MTVVRTGTTGSCWATRGSAAVRADIGDLTQFAVVVAQVTLVADTGVAARESMTPLLPR